MDAKITKKALLASGLSAVACLSMLIGTTYAWFTDEASVTVKTIQAGTLDIDITDANDTSVIDTTLSFGEALWEPGCTHALAPLTVKNIGNLSVKYKVVVTGINGDAKLNDVITWTINGAEEGTLAVGVTSELNISGTMKTDAGNEYMGLSISDITLTVVATQINDAAQYKPLPVRVSTAEKLEEALANPETTTTIVNFDKETTHTQKIEVPADKELVIKDGNFGTTEMGDAVINAKENSTVVLDGGYYTSPSNTQLIDAQKSGSEIVINEGTYKGDIGVWMNSDAKVIINGGVFDVWGLAMCDGDKAAASMTITGGTFTIGGGGFMPSVQISLTITGGTFNKDPSDYVPETHKVVTNEDGTFTVTAN